MPVLPRRRWFRGGRPRLPSWVSIDPRSPARPDPCSRWCRVVSVLHQSADHGDHPRHRRYCQYADHDDLRYPVEPRFNLARAWSALTEAKVTSSTISDPTGTRMGERGSGRRVRPLPDRIGGLSSGGTAHDPSAPSAVVLPPRYGRIDRDRLKRLTKGAVGLQVRFLRHPSSWRFGHGSRWAGRTCAGVVLIAGMGTLPAIVGAAGVGARATGISSLSVGTWGAKASLTSMTFTSNSVQTLTVTNIGTIALSARSYSVTISKPAGKAPTFTFFRCAVAWVSTTCSRGAGNQIGGTLAAGSTTMITSTAPLAPGASMYLQVAPSGVKRATTVTIVPQISSPAELRDPVQSDQ